MTPTEAADIVLEILGDLPEDTLPSTERLLREGLLAHYSAVYSLDPHVLRYLVLYPLADRSAESVPHGCVEILRCLHGECACGE